VSYLFDRKGVLIIEKQEGIDVESLMLASIEAGAEDFNAEQEYYEILCEPGSFSQLREILENQGYAFLEAGLQMLPRTMTHLTEKEAASMEKLSELLEDLDDVQNIYHNWENE
jgi:transcriptional/translational regulatory protein YebC/TACO1